MAAMISPKAIHPPESAKYDAVNFAHWVQSVGRRLLTAGIDVAMTPVVQSDGELYLTVDTDNATARRIKAALYS
jgi:hypothetical protein